MESWFAVHVASSANALTCPTNHTFDIQIGLRNYVAKKGLARHTKSSADRRKTKHGLQQVFNCARAVASHTHGLFIEIGMTQLFFHQKHLWELSKPTSTFVCTALETASFSKKSGVPVGGFLSLGLLHLHLSIAGQNFVRYRWPEHVRRYNLTHHIFEYFSPSRYGDDLHVASKNPYVPHVFRNIFLMSHT